MQRINQKKIALLTNFSWVGISTSVINTALYWESRNYFVDLYAEQPDKLRFPIPDFYEKNIAVIETNLSATWPLNDISFYLSEFSAKAGGYEWVIAFDCDALIRAGICRGFGKYKLIYHSLEFYEPIRNQLRSIVKKWLERYYATKCCSIFSQDRVRIAYLSNDLRIDVDRFNIIYNSPIGDPIDRREDYFRSIFNISPNKIIILCIGSLIKEHCIINLVDSIVHWPEHVVLVMHGWFTDRNLRNYVKYQETQLPGRIFISERLFSHKDRYIPYLSSDIGFVGFDSDSNNIRLAAGSAGKLYDFLKTGTPIIGFETPGMRALIEDNEVGLVFSDYSELSSIIPRLLACRDKYRNNCFRASRNYEFNRQYSKVFNNLGI